MKATINRKDYQTKQTLGTLTVEDNGKVLFECKTLELPWFCNTFQKSCIPKGTYKVIPRKSAKFGDHLHITDVPGRTYILIHAGNKYTDILGCVLVGDSFGDVNGDGITDVLNSKYTLKNLLKIAPKGFDLKVI